jgi:hypothetical protein
LGGINALLLNQKDRDRFPIQTVEVIMIPKPTQSPPQKQAPKAKAPPIPAQQRAPASMEAPSPPSAEEWQLASTYTLKNSKRYRNAWGQQVRSMMGTAVEGPDQGVVRFEIEIAPSGKVVRVDTLWTTSEKAEALARAAIEKLPPLPPTPTGKPLIFEKTISFQPFDSGWPPVYKYDCLPDPPKPPYPWAWDGSSPPNPPGYDAVKNMKVAPPAPRPTECPDAPEDSVEAEAADIQRQIDMWESSRLDKKR